jgi:transcriptional regulator with XRE-family HTH domain
MSASTTMRAETAANRRRELRDFLVARRAALSPEAVGLPANIRRRRTPGLRREEVAALAGVGVSWYTWLEQGREIGVSAETLERIASALRLTPTDAAYLYALAGVRSETPQVPRVEDAIVQQAVDAVRVPALVASAWWDIEAYNQLANRIFRFAETSGTFSRNQIWRLFMDPERRAVYVDWELMAEGAVGALRAVSAIVTAKPYVDPLVSALTEGSVEFTRMWNAQHTTPLAALPIRLQLPRIGQMEFTSLRLQFPGGEGRLFITLLPSNRRTREAVGRLKRNPR